MVIWLGVVEIDLHDDPDDGFATPSINYTPTFHKDNQIKFYTYAPVCGEALITIIN